MTETQAQTSTYGEVTQAGIALVRVLGDLGKTWIISRNEQRRAANQQPAPTTPNADAVIRTAAVSQAASAATEAAKLSSTVPAPARISQDATAEEKARALAEQARAEARARAMAEQARAVDDGSWRERLPQAEAEGVRDRARARVETDHRGRADGGAQLRADESDGIVDAEAVGEDAIAPRGVVGDREVGVPHQQDRLGVVRRGDDQRLRQHAADEGLETTQPVLAVGGEDDGDIDPLLTQLTPYPGGAVGVLGRREAVDVVHGR